MEWRKGERFLFSGAHCAKAEASELSRHVPSHRFFGSQNEEKALNRNVGTWVSSISFEYLLSSVWLRLRT